MSEIQLHPVETESQYEAALEKISKLMEADVAPESKKGQILSGFVKLVDEYERQNYGLPDSTPAAIVEYHMSRLGLNQSELAEAVNIPPSRISDIINENRALSKSQIRKFAEFFDISTDLLIGDPDETKAA